MNAFLSCPDKLNYCTSNMVRAQDISGTTALALTDKFSLYYTIGTNTGSPTGVLN